MKPKNTQEALSRYIAKLDEERSLACVQQLVDDGIDPLIIFDLCHAGMVQVGNYYEKGKYAISGLIMAGEIMRQIGRMVFPLLEQKTFHADSGKIVLGTVEGDIHFIGKDIFKTLVRGHGFTVHDLGVDVPRASFLSAVHEIKPDIVGFSCLISGAYDALRDSIAFLKDNLPQYVQPRAYIVGGRMDQLIAKEIGADWWTSDAMEGVHLCRKIMSKNNLAGGG